MTKSTIDEVTCSCPVNIAVIKYWGKSNNSLILPTNSSLSITLNIQQLSTTTTIRLLPSASSTTTFYLNHLPSTLNTRTNNIINLLKSLRKDLEQNNPSLDSIHSLDLLICSFNNFPTAAGLASSASGYSCLAYTLANLYQLPITNSQLSIIARQGSGSACRSMFGGFVAWDAGSCPLGSDSIARQVAPESHWPDMEAIVLVVCDSEKDIGSTVGMQTTVETSQLFSERIKQVPAKMTKITNAILDKDFDSFAEITMRDSNQFHSVCLDTYPPIFYLNDISKSIIQAVTEYNQAYLNINKGYQCAYTFDAGPNAVLFLPRDNVANVLSMINHFFPPTDVQAIPLSPENNAYYSRALEFMGNSNYPDPMIAKMKSKINPKGSLVRIISTKIGDGPRVLAKSFDSDVSLLTIEGLPKNMM